MKKLFLKLLTLLTIIDGEVQMNIFITLVNYLEINIVPLHESFVLKQYSNFINLYSIFSTF